MSVEDKIAKLALDLLKTIPKGCHPIIGREWTIFSAICEENEANFRIVAAGTGTKCLAASQISPDGDLLHDSHGEVIAIRAFKRYLFSEINNFIETQESKLLEGSLDEGFSLKPHIKYHFYTTHPPCGDATIFPLTSSESDGQPLAKKLKIVNDASFTGAKLIGGNQEDVMAQDEGALRTKPGRGERTLSMSCSDKLAKILVMGIQGSFLCSLLKSPIYLESFILARNSGCQLMSLERALYKRFSCRKGASYGSFQLNVPRIVESTLEFPYPKNDDLQPCPKTIIWSRVKEKPLEISVDGRRQGVSKKNISKPSSRLQICRLEMFKAFQRILIRKYPDKEKELTNLNYRETKRQYSAEYDAAWRNVKENYFKQWTTKPVIVNDLKTD